MSIALKGVILQLEGDLILKGGGEQCFKKLFCFPVDAMLSYPISTQILTKIYKSW